MSERELYSEQSEHGLIMALMMKPELCEEVGAFLGAEHFGYVDNGALYSAILSLHSKAIHPDPLALAELIERLPSGEPTMPYAHQLWGNKASAENAVSFAKTIVDRHTARQMYEVGQRLMELACTKGDIVAQLSKAQGEIMGIGRHESSPDVISYRDLFDRVIEEIDQKMNGKEQAGIDIGLSDLDKIVCKFRPGNLVIVAGRPGTGKTVLATGLADKIATREGKSALVFSLEMPKEELALRSIAAAGGIDKGRLDSGKLLDDELVKLAKATDLLKKSDVRVCDKPALTMSRIVSIARFENRVRKLDLIVVDYLTMIATDPNVRHGTRSAEIGSYSRGFKNLAKELGIPIVVLSQFNRGMESRGGDGRPKISDLRDSGEIEQDADIVILGFRDESTPDGAGGVTEWDVAKVRHAKPGRCLLQFQGQYQRFLNSAVSWDDYKSGGQTTGKSFKDFVK